MKLERIFLSFSILFTGIFVILVALALFGWFRWPVVFGFLVLTMLCFIGDLFFIVRPHFSRNTFSGRGLLLIFFLLLSFFTTFFLHHDLPRGRDPMGFLAAALELTQQHTLAFSDVFTHPFHPFRLIREPNVFTSQFFPGFVVYLGVFALFGGVPWALSANAFVALLTLIALFFVGKRTGGFWVGAGTVFLFGTSYLFFWFPRRSLSENLFMFFLWVAVLLFLRGYQTKNLRFFLFSFFPIFASLLVRVEGLSLLFTFFGVFLGILLSRDFSQMRKFRAPEICIMGLSFFSATLLPLYFFRFGDEYFFRSFTHGSLLQILPLAVISVLFLPVVTLFVCQRPSFFSKLKFIRFFRIGLMIVLVGFLLFFFFRFSPQDFVTWKQYRTLFVLEIFWKYGFAPFVFLIFFALYKRFYGRQYFFILCLLSPFAVFFSDPLIALDQPWFMRRFFSAVIPFIFLLSAHAIVYFFTDKPFLIPRVFLSISVLHIFLFWPVASFADHAGVSEEMDRFARTYPRDAVYVMTPGWDWQQWAYVLHYIYGFRVLPNFQNLTRDELSSIFAEAPEVYIISKTGPGSVPGTLPDNLSPYSEFSFSYPELLKTSNINYYLDQNDLLEVGFLRFSERNTPPRKINTVYENWVIYRVNTIQDIDTSLFPAVREKNETD